MAFLETPRFPENISYGATGGAEYKTEVVAISSGYEQRNITWSKSRASYDVAHAARLENQIYDIIKFFRAVKGRAHGFRFKDWSDFQCSVTEGILGTGFGDGTPDYQLIKKYSAGALYDTRDIRKPIESTVKVYRNTVLQGTPANYSLDETTGVVTFLADSSKNIDANVVENITAITNANPAVVTVSTPHGWATGDKIKLKSVGGMTQVNNIYFTITVINTTQFSIGVDSTSYGTYTSGGTATKFGITQTSPVRVNATGHGYSNGNLIYITGATGMTNLNGKAYEITNVTTDYFELLGIDGTTFSEYSTLGKAEKYLQPSDVLTWEGEFDVPVRFDTDKIDVELITSNIQGWSSIPIVEIRV